MWPRRGVQRARAKGCASAGKGDGPAGRTCTRAHRRRQRHISAIRGTGRCAQGGRSRCGRHREGAIDEGDGVVGLRAGYGGHNRVAAHVAARGRRGRKALSKAIAAYRAGHSSAKGRVGGAVHAGCVIGGRGQHSRCHRQCAIYDHDIVVAQIGAARSRNNRIAPHVAGRGRRGGKALGKGVAVLRAVDGSGEGRIGCSIGPGSVVRCDGQGLRGAAEMVSVPAFTAAM